MRYCKTFVSGTETFFATEYASLGRFGPYATHEFIQTSGSLMQNALDIVRARLAAIVDSSQDAILAKDLDGLVTAWNPAATRLYGYTDEEIIGRPIRLLIPDDHAGESDRLLAEVLAGRDVDPYDTERVTKSGKRVAVSIAVSPIRSAAGEVVGASTIARDITDRLLAEEERAWTAMLVRQSADAIIALDPAGVITTWNPAAESMFGYSAAVAIGQPAEQVIRSNQPGEQAAMSSSVREHGQTLRYEAQRLHRDGHELIVEISMAPLATAAGAPAGAVVSIRDVTEARAAEAAIAQARVREQELERELEQTRRLESVGQLAGGVAHDFNNLLSVMLNLGMFLSETLAEGSPERDDADEIVLTAQRAATLTRQLLIFSRRDVSKPEIFDLGELVSGLSGLLHRALGEGIALEVWGDRDLRTIEMDRGQMEQILVNLAVNARDAMPKGGRLIIESRNTVVDDAYARTRVGLAEGDYVTLTVSDTGDGMDTTVLEHAFDPFFTTKPDGQGTGLGLATVYGIVAKAGGRVALYSEPGRGTSVKVHIPAADRVATPTSEERAAGPRGQGETVLVVEDAADVQKITARILTAAGYRVLTAASADEAIDAVRDAQPIDLVLTDVIMPGMTGTELVAVLRADDPGLRVVFMSGYSHAMLTPDILDHPSSAFVEKPFTAAQLRSTLRALLDAS